MWGDVYSRLKYLPLCCLWLPQEGFFYISIHSFLLLPTNELPWWLGFFASAEQEAVVVKMPPVCYCTLLEKIHTFYNKAVQCEKSPISFAFEFSCQDILFLAKSSLRGAFRGYCCAVMATILNSLFQAFTKYQDICYKWFAMMVWIFMSLWWSVCNLMRKKQSFRLRF